MEDTRKLSFYRQIPALTVSLPINTFAAIADSSRFYRSLPLTTLVVRQVPSFSGAVSNDSREVT